MADLFLLISYDVSTQSEKGRKRLRKVAKICESCGQRVQKSVFECTLTQTRFEEIERKLLAVINENEDNLRIYRLHQAAGWNVKQYGNFRAVDFDGPLII